jgi:membrane protease YdiL (CAAX protease family)
MDKKSVAGILSFYFIFCLIILPPLFVQRVPPGIFATWSFPLRQIFYAGIAGIIFWFFYIRNRKKRDENKGKKRILFFINSGYTLVTFGSLCTAAAGTELFFHFAGTHTSLTPVFPSSARTLFYCILNFAAASFFEEVIYRLYLPDMLFRYLSYIPRLSPRVSECISEAGAVILFAFAHRYLGAPSVVNAALACIILRVCCKKSGTVWTNTAAHFAYNILSLALFTAV